ncbi:MAG: hypothetical protein IJW75_01495 [Alphaproteobacteria bacterium]|nr:hypothetical protein [Alphaproteobacteria bacterium]
MTYTETLDANNVVKSLSQEHKTIFLNALFFLANIDGSRDEEEIKRITDLAKTYKIEQSEQIFKETTQEQIFDDLKKLNNRRVCLELIKEMCLLGHSDSDLTDDETLFIGHAGIAMGIELEKIEQISNWIIDKIIWLEQGKIIFED